MYTKLLKELYYKERMKLEGMWIYKQESKLNLLKFKRDTINKIESHLTISELLGRGDIADEIKDNLLRDRDNEDRFKEQLEKIITDEVSAITDEENAELKNAAYSASEYADYLFQLEKVLAIHGELIDKGVFPEEVYTEQKILDQKTETEAK
ncbi:MAG: hypothetical protein V2A64_04565 [Candidatus Omnitrophota bacterium]